MKLEHNYTIDGKIVKAITKIDNIEVFIYEKEESMYKLYFVKKNEVIKTLEIFADCGQNVGYISGLEFS